MALTNLLADLKSVDHSLDDLYSRNFRILEEERSKLQKMLSQTPDEDKINKIINNVTSVAQSLSQKPSQVGQLKTLITSLKNYEKEIFIVPANDRVQYGLLTVTDVLPYRSQLLLDQLDRLKKSAASIDQKGQYVVQQINELLISGSDITPHKDFNKAKVLIQAFLNL